MLRQAHHTAQPAPADFAPHAFGSAATLQIKICGLRTFEHALVATAAGATMLGFVFAPSKRQITPDAAAEIVLALRATRHWVPKVVGLFVNATAREIVSTTERCPLDLIQLCGDEPVALIDDLPVLPILRAIRLTGHPAEQAWLACPRDQVMPLVDAHIAGSYGGTGNRADWNAAATLAHTRPLMLAGGLTPENVGEALAHVQPWGVDVSSGVEHAGHKDSQRIQQFIAQARVVDQKAGLR